MAPKTKNITKFEKASVKQIGQEVLAAVQSVAAAHGLNVEYRGGSYDDLDFTTKVKFTVADGHRNEYTTNAARLGLKSEGLDATFTYKTRTYKIVGLDTWKRYPVQTEIVGTGKRSDFTVEAIQEAMGWPKPQPWTAGKPTTGTVGKCAGMSVRVHTKLETAGRHAAGSTATAQGHVWVKCEDCSKEAGYDVGHPEKAAAAGQ